MSESSTRCLSSASSPHLLSPRRKALSSKAIVLLNQGRLAEARILLEAAAARAHAEQLYASALRAENNLAATPWHQERVLPALRALLELPFEHVIVSHGEPLHDRNAFERALEPTTSSSRRAGQSPWSRAVGHMRAAERRLVP